MNTENTMNSLRLVPWINGIGLALITAAAGLTGASLWVFAALIAAIVGSYVVDQIVDATITVTIED